MNERTCRVVFLVERPVCVGLGVTWLSSRHHGPAASSTRFVVVGVSSSTPGRVVLVFAGISVLFVALLLLAKTQLLGGVEHTCTHPQLLVNAPGTSRQSRSHASAVGAVVTDRPTDRTTDQRAPFVCLRQLKHRDVFLKCLSAQASQKK